MDKHLREHTLKAPNPACVGGWGWGADATSLEKASRWSYMKRVLTTEKKKLARQSWKEERN